MVGLINRERESAKIRELWEKDGPALGLIYGRRRLGKSYFLQNFLKGKRGIYFLAASSTSLENLGELLDQVRMTFPDRDDATLENYNSWRTGLRLLCELARDEPLLVVLDEFSYLSEADPSIVSVLQVIWDRDARDTHLKLILCGSELGTLSAMDDYGAPLHGRFHWVERFQPLDYYDAGRFIAAADEKGSYSERKKLVAYGFYGGSGQYLAELDPRRPLAENVARQILDPSGIFHREGETLIRQERVREYATFNAILAAIAGGATSNEEIASRAHVPSKSVPTYLTRLQQLGWIEQESPFGEGARRSIYKLSDNMLLAWYRWVFRFRSALQITPPEEAWREFVEPDIPDYMGRFVFEKIAHQHIRRFYARYGLPIPVEMGRWWSRKHDVEIDLVARLKDGSHLFGSCKWASSPLKVGELADLQAKVKAVPHQQWKEKPRYAIFSGGGFDPKLAAVAEDEGVLLIGAKELFRAD